MVNVLKYNDLTTIEAFLRNREYDNGNLDVVMFIETQERLNALNREYFYMVNDAKTPYDSNVVIPELTIKIGNVNFIYKVKPKEKEEETKPEDGKKK